MSQERIQTRCPACGNQTLFIGRGGYLTCSWLKCPNPGFDDALADKRRTELCAATKQGFFAGFIAARPVNVEQAWEDAAVRQRIDSVPGEQQ